MNRKPIAVSLRQSDAPGETVVKMIVEALLQLGLAQEWWTVDG
jgi:hypothetical protein